MTTVVDIAAAGNALFLVTLGDEQGTSEHEVGVPDGLVEELLGDDAGEVALRDVVLASLDWWVARTAREDLPRSFSLDELRGVGDYDEQLPARARRWAAAPSPSLRAPDPDDREGGQHGRLVEEVRREQEAGEASSSPPDGL